MRKIKTGLAAFAVVLLMISQGTFAQQKHWVFFADKGACEMELLQNPTAFLSQAAIDRRQKQNIQPDFHDLPLYQPYLAALENEGIQVVSQSRWLNAITVEGDYDLIALQALCPQITGMRPVAHTQTTAFRNDLHPAGNSPSQKTTSVINYGNTRTQTELIGLDYVHDLGFTGDGMTIAVLDAGFQNADTVSVFDSLWATGKIRKWYDFVDRDTLVFQENYHGEAVLSTMGGNISGTYVGTAPHANYLLARTEEVAFERHVEEDYWLEAMEWADLQGADLINSSLGYSTFDAGEGDYTYWDMDGNTTIISRAADLAASRGLIVVCGAGNEGNSAWNNITAPCDGDSVLCVGAVDQFGNAATFSGLGPSSDGQIKPDVTAMGASAAIVGPTGNYGVSQGTSFSAPQVCGLAACLWQAHPDRSNMDIIAAIQRSAHIYQAPNTTMGYGIPNARTADSLLTVMDTMTIGIGEALPHFKVEMYPNPARERVVLDWSQTDTHISDVSVWSASGQEVIRVAMTPGFQQLSIETGSWATGLYLVRFQSADGAVWTRKLHR